MNAIFYRIPILTLLLPSVALSASIIVNNGSSVIGNGGSISGITTQINSGGSVAPGTSPGCLTFADLNLNASSELAVELSGTTACTDYDQTVVTGTISINNANLNLAVWNSFQPAVNTVYTIVDNQGTSAVSGVFTGLAEGATTQLDGDTLQISYVGGDGNEITLTVTAVGAANQAPVAANMNASGEVKIGATLTGSYSYSDGESDPEGNSTYQWYQADDATATQGLQAISGATATTYTPTAANENKYIAFAVTPVAQSGTSPGVETASTFFGPANYVYVANTTDNPGLMSQNPGGWSMAEHPRMLADVNGDGQDDLVGFGCCSVSVALSNGTDFDAPQDWVSGFGSFPSYGGWEVNKHPRIMADVNGDGMADVAGFGNDGVGIALSNGAGFDTPIDGITGSFGYNQGWRVTDNPRFMTDVDGDGKDDIVGFAGDGVYVATSAGSGFNPAQLWIANFGGFASAGGWDTSKHPRMMADINGDGKADVVGFGNDGIGIGLSTGSSFTAQNGLQGDFGYNQGYRINLHPRMMADVNGDGKDDVVAFAGPAVAVALSNGNSFDGSTVWIYDFVYDTGWRTDLHLRMMDDVNGDGMADIVGFGAGGVAFSRSTGSSFDNQQTLAADMAYNQGYRVGIHPRMVGDINGDGMVEPIAIHDNGTLSSITGY